MPLARHARLALIVSAAVIPLPASAQVVRGTVVDRSGAVPVTEAILRLVDQEGDPVAATVSDTSGAFLLRAPVSGRYRVQAERLGYATALSGILPLERGQVLRVVLRLDPGTVTLDPLIVMGRPRLERLDAVGFYERREEFGERLREATFLDREEFLRMNPFHPTDIFEQVPGFRVRIVNRRRVVEGRRGCRPAYFVNGWHNPRDNEVWISSGNVAGVEVYPAGRAMPAEYLAHGAGCGAIVFWTR
jgi:hypothetical protein